MASVVVPGSDRAAPLAEGLPRYKRKYAVSEPSAVTRQVRVEVSCRYLPERSEPRRGLWFFGYRIRITNEGQDTVQLLHRHWIITDADGHVSRVDGPGVVGEQPVLSSLETFEYTSGCPLPTPFGSMRGSYEMLNSRGETFDTEIPAFALCMPGSLN